MVLKDTKLIAVPWFAMIHTRLKYLIWKLNLVTMRAIFVSSL